LWLGTATGCPRRERRGAPLAGTSGKRARTELSARERIGIAGPSAVSPRPEWLRVSGPRHGHSAGFLLCIDRSRSESRLHPAGEAVPAGMTSMHSERPGWTAGYSGMEPAIEYRRFAQECRRLAREAKTERHRVIMEEMAQAWEMLAKETDREGAHASP